ncbi:MAG: hypothetical protein M1816_004279 [Peltula sp. TS41687]|nr:MAG: hypothetical protein M1816_004279 [Peltula sp. TS41687]
MDTSPASSSASGAFAPPPPPLDGRPWSAISPPQNQSYIARSFGRCIYLPCRMDWAAEERPKTIGEACIVAEEEEMVRRIEEDASMGYLDPVASVKASLETQPDERGVEEHLAVELSDACPEIEREEPIVEGELGSESVQEEYNPLSDPVESTSENKERVGNRSQEVQETWINRRWESQYDEMRAAERCSGPMSDMQREPLEEHELMIKVEMQNSKSCGMEVHVRKANGRPFPLLTLQNLVVLWGLYDGPSSALPHAESVRDGGGRTDYRSDRLAAMHAIEREGRKSECNKGRSSNNIATTKVDINEETEALTGNQEGENVVDKNGKSENHEAQAKSPHGCTSLENMADEATINVLQRQNDDAWTRAIYACQDEAELCAMLGKFKDSVLSLIHHVKGEAKLGRGDRVTLEFRHQPGTLSPTEIKFWALFTTGMVHWAQAVADQNLTVNVIGQLELNDLFSLIDFPDEGQRHMERTTQGGCG